MNTSTSPHVPGAGRPLDPARDRVQQMLHAPLLPTLLRLATPNVMGLFAMTIVIGYDGYILGRIGADALAGIALVFPLTMLMLQMSAGGIGGATTAAVARALGGGREADANRLAQQALLVAALMALVFMAVMLGMGRRIFSGMGGQGAALEAALAYSNVMFGGAAVMWFTNVLAAVVRGVGNMVLPSALLLGSALLHLALCPLLVFGWGPVPALGVAGAALSTLVVNGLATVWMLAYLWQPAGAVHLRRLPWRLHLPMLRDLLRVGLPASLSPVISNASIAVATAFVGSYGTAALAGFGVAARLEYILVPIAFGFGTALTAMVATNMGAGQTARAVRVAWVGGALVAAITGTIGVATALMPALWMNLFTDAGEVRAFGASYLNIVGTCYTFFGLGLALFFASQGAARLFWPLTASVGRLVILAVGGWLCVHLFQAPASALFGVIALSFVVYGSTIALAIRLGSWTR
jgi:putative MATE family efflux protein